MPAHEGVDLALDVEGIAKGLSGVLADTHRLIFKTPVDHWNAEYALHRTVAYHENREQIVPSFEV